jgi:hypothetical protein
MAIIIKKLVRTSTSEFSGERRGKGRRKAIKSFK